MEGVVSWNVDQYALIGVTLCLFGFLGFRRGANRELRSMIGIGLAMLLASVLVPNLGTQINFLHKLGCFALAVMDSDPSSGALLSVVEGVGSARRGNQRLPGGLLRFPHTAQVRGGDQSAGWRDQCSSGKQPDDGAGGCLCCGGLDCPWPEGVEIAQSQGVGLSSEGERGGSRGAD